MFAQPVLTSLLKKWPVFLLWSLTFLTSSAVCQAQFFTRNGDFGYSLNSENHVFDVTEDGTRAVSLTTVDSPDFGSSLTSFDPVTGTKFDSKIAGSSPQEVRVVETAGGTKVAVLNFNWVAVYNMDQAGKLTLVGKKVVSYSNADFYGNLALSSQNSVGFTMVLTENYDPELVVFSLDTSAIIKRLPISGDAGRFVGLKEANGKSTLVYIHFPAPSSPPELVVLDVTNPAQPTEIGPIQLSDSQGGYDFTEFAFSSDARYLFVANYYLDFTAVDLTEMKVVDRLAANIVIERMAMFESETKRMLALQTFISGSPQDSHLLLVDATDPANLRIVKQSSQFLSYFAFAKSGNQLLGLYEDTIKSLSVPSLLTIWEEHIEDPIENLPQQVMVFGQPERVLGAWGVFTSLFGSFPVREADVSITKYGSAHGVLSGANINYSFRVKNNGPTTATRVTLTDKLPAGLSLVAATPSAGVCSGTTAVVCDFGDLPVGAYRTVKITATPLKAGQFVNTATVKSHDLDLNLSNNAAEKSTTLVPLALMLNPGTVLGPCQHSITGRVSISSPAPSGGVVVNLTNNNPAATTPASVTIPAGKISVDFTIQIAPPSSTRTGTITATYNGHSFGVKLTVLSTTGVQALSLTPNPVTGGDTVTGKVLLACKATTDTVVTLSSSDESVASPTVASINIPAGATSKTFTINTAFVPTSSTAVITAKANGVSKSAILKVQ